MVRVIMFASGVVLGALLMHVLGECRSGVWGGDTARSAVASAAPAAPAPSCHCVPCPETTALRASSSLDGDEPALSSLFGFTVEQRLEHNPLYRFAKQHKGAVIWKWLYYFDTYWHVFERLRASPLRKIRLLELGVNTGGAIDMWKHFFGADRLEYHGLDMNPKCRRFHAPSNNVFIHSGSQGDEEFLRSIVANETFDVILDDASHVSSLTEKSFTVLIDAVRERDGIYLIEDLQGQSAFTEKLFALAAALGSGKQAAAQKKPFPGTLYPSTLSLQFYPAIAVVQRNVNVASLQKAVQYGKNEADFLPNAYFREFSLLTGQRKG